jgi:hypothetical protein
VSQRPDATVVAGYRTWQSLGRQVRRGAKGIGIFGYSTKTTAQEVTDDAGKTDEKTTTRAFFPVRTVFDISDTDGEGISLPTEVDSARNPHPDASDKAYQRASTWLTDQGWDVQRVDITGAIRGYTNHTEKLVRVADHLDDINAARVLLHEAVHVILHGPGQRLHHHRAIRGQPNPLRDRGNPGRRRRVRPGRPTGPGHRTDFPRYVACWATAAAGTITDADAIAAAVRGTAAAILHAVNTIAAALGLDD